TPNAPVRAGEVLTDARLRDPPALPYGPGLVARPRRNKPSLGGVLNEVRPGVAPGPEPPAPSGSTGRPRVGPPTGKTGCGPS
ncbi:Flp pilus assembly protein CpaB, partial [Nocardiopsis alba]